MISNSQESTFHNLFIASKCPERESVVGWDGSDFIIFGRFRVLSWVPNLKNTIDCGWRVALRVPPAVIRLTIYRRCEVGGWSAGRPFGAKLFMENRRFSDHNSDSCCQISFKLPKNTDYMYI